MPRSTGIFKEQTLEYIKNNVSRQANILDVGAGIGTYSHLLKPEGYSNIDCVEVFPNYIIDYNLGELYREVYLDDITTWEAGRFAKYDLVIFGDIIEHVERQKAIELLSKIPSKEVIVAVPFNSEQGEHFGNKYEIHLQADLTNDIFLNEYPGFTPLCVRYDYGIYVKNQPNDDTYVLDLGTDEIEKLRKSGRNIINLNNKEFSDITIVTGLWDLGRGELTTFGRPYEQYLERFAELLENTQNPMFIYVSESDVDFVWKHRRRDNTKIKVLELDELKTQFDFTEQTNAIRVKEEWQNQAGWLSESPQCKLEMYNPVVMSKMFLLNNARIWNPFDSEYYFWIDGGITTTLATGYLPTINKLSNLLDKFTFICYPYEATTEIHGFTADELYERAGRKTDKVARGGFFGGPAETISQANGLYYSELDSSLTDGFMGTEESIFTILLYRYPEIFDYYPIEGNGLIYKFFQDLIDKTAVKKNENNSVKLNADLNTKNVNLYVITFNSPNQFRALLESINNYDSDLLSQTNKIVLDNSTDKSFENDYENLCKEYGFERIKKNNIGIHRGRQFIAEHFDQSGADFMLFFEDDMLLSHEGKCQMGFTRSIDNLYRKSLEITKNNDLDFLKLSFKEFYGDNSIQWSWYNLPQNKREEYWPDNNKLPKKGLSPTAPKTKYDYVSSYRGVPFAVGEVYYCNWPQVVTRHGNKKMFIDTKFAHPYEQTSMSHIYMLMRENKIKSGVLLGSPVDHNRFEFYEAHERKEN